MLSLVDDGTASPGRLLVLTFDKNAVDSARQKLDEAGGDALDPKPYILTLNAFGLKILKRLFKNEVLTLAAESSFKNKIIREKLKVLRSDAELRDLLPDNLETRVFADAFSVFKNQLFAPRSFDRDELAYFILGARQTQAFLPTAEELGEVVTEERLKASADALIWLYEQVEYEMLHSGHMDFDDQKLRAWVGLCRDAEKRKRVQKFYQEIIVDEFQDLNRLDFELIKLVSAHTRLTVTGDDDQAIYGFRGSDADYLIDLQNQLGRPVSLHELRMNYRCANNVVQHAAQLIAHNKHRIPKHPLAHRKADANINVIGLGNSNAEATVVVSHIVTQQKAHPELAYSDFAILYRTDAQSLPLQVQLILNDVPYSVKRQDNLATNAALVNLVATLQLRQALVIGGAFEPQWAARCLRAYFYWIRREDESALEACFRESRDFFAVLHGPRFPEKFAGLRLDEFEKSLRKVMGARNLTDTLKTLSEGFPGLNGGLPGGGRRQQDASRGDIRPGRALQARHARVHRHDGEDAEAGRAAEVRAGGRWGGVEDVLWVEGAAVAHGVSR